MKPRSSARQATSHARPLSFLATERHKPPGLVRHLIRIQEAERRRVSEELHDDLGQQLALIGMQIDCLDDGSTPDNISQRVQGLRRRVADMDRDLHRICYRLHPVVLETLGLPAAVEVLCREFSEGTGITIALRHGRLAKKLSKAVALCAYRLIQEALHNVFEHSGAKEAEVSLRNSSSSLEIRVSDSGCGFDRSAVEARGGFGLISLTGRVRAVGGQVTIKTAPGKGTTLTARIPTSPAISARRR